MRILLLATISVAIGNSGVAIANPITVPASSDCRAPGVAAAHLPMGSLLEFDAPARVAGKRRAVLRRPGFPAGSFSTSGRASVFNDGATASGRQGGISTWFYGRLGGYWLIHSPNGRSAVQRQNDNGPASWTGRWLDITPSAVGSWGYSFGGFPTDEGTWHGVFLGYALPKGVGVGELGSPLRLGVCGATYGERFRFRVIRRGPRAVTSGAKSRESPHGILSAVPTK